MRNYFTNKNYAAQDRGEDSRYRKYLEGMDSVVVEKVATASAYFHHHPGNVIVDVGMASGTSTHILAVLFPECRIIGVDINPRMVEIARSSYHLPNLEFRVDDGEKLDSFQVSTVDGFFNCSSVHHITSFNNYDPHRAFQTFKRQVELLKPGGVIVVRDFVKPPEREVILEFPSPKEKNKPSDVDLLIDFSKTARSLAKQDERGFPLKEITARGAMRRFLLSLPDAVEFIRRKDYRDDWEVELQEEYGYFTQKEFEEVFSELGTRLIVSFPLFNPWIIKNRYEGKFRLLDKQENELGFPPTNFVIAVEKLPGKGTRLVKVRDLPVHENCFLKTESYRNNKTNHVFDLARRPFPVIDILPWFRGEDLNLKIIAKHGYPRPIINATGDNNIIDDKHYSGYITEGITAMRSETGAEENILLALQERAGISTENIIGNVRSLTYYTSPGGIDEIVEAWFTEIDKDCELKSLIPANYSGLTDSGEIRVFDAKSLLKTAQVGGLPEARLEMNIYNLMHAKKISPGKWLGVIPEIKECRNLEITCFRNTSAQEQNSIFEPFSGNAGFIHHERSMFREDRVSEVTNILEYIIPEEYSLNTVVTLPVFKYKGKVYLGIEPRHLPVPHIREGKSLLLCAPAYRLPGNVKNYSDLASYLQSKRIYGSKINSYYKLGEKYLPCAGITPEQVYPYIVNLEKPTTDLYWIEVKDLLGNRHKLRDGHLLICLFRLMHILTNDDYK
ncbi:MAG: class I SAM-dependent methyltransferase [Bacteroidota bacterium]